MYAESTKDDITAKQFFFPPIEQVEGRDHKSQKVRKFYKQTPTCRGHCTDIRPTGGGGTDQFELVFWGGRT
jgi:hypothetical protein